MLYFNSTNGYPFYFCFEKVKSNRTKATCPKFLIFKMYEEKVSEPKLNAD